MLKYLVITVIFACNVLLRTNYYKFISRSTVDRWKLGDGMVIHDLCDMADRTTNQCPDAAGILLVASVIEVSPLVAEMGYYSFNAYARGRCYSPADLLRV